MRTTMSIGVNVLAGIAVLYVVVEILELVVFFSSRRRHTRYWRDWSSDVCSSDLKRLAPDDAQGDPDHARPFCVVDGAQPGAVAEGAAAQGPDEVGGGARKSLDRRSEERRVGKEGRSRWSPYH